YMPHTRGLDRWFPANEEIDSPRVPRRSSANRALGLHDRKRMTPTSFAWRRPLGSALLASIMLCAVASPAHAAIPDRKAQADALYQHAQHMLERRSIDGRRAAIADLERATLLEPNDPGYQLTLARVYYQVGFVSAARRRFERVVALTPNDAEGRYGL